MTYSLHLGAEQDIAIALDFYTEQARVLVAQRFLDEFERVAKLLAAFPASARQLQKVAAYFRCAFFCTPSYTEALRRAFESSSFVTSTESLPTVAQGGSAVAYSRDATPNPSIEWICLRNAAHVNRWAP